eukprot:3780766-Alexandrium_andersonii.AAC.1
MRAKGLGLHEHIIDIAQHRDVVSKIASGDVVLCTPLLEATLEGRLPGAAQYRQHDLTKRTADGDPTHLGKEPTTAP